MSARSNEGLLRTSRKALQPTAAACCKACGLLSRLAVSRAYSIFSVCMHNTLSKANSRFTSMTSPSSSSSCTPNSLPTSTCHKIPMFTYLLGMHTGKKIERNEWPHVHAEASKIRPGPKTQEYARTARSHVSGPSTRTTVYPPSSSRAVTAASRSWRSG